MKKRTIFLFVFLFVVIVVSASSSINYLSKGQADTLYCPVSGGCLGTDPLVVGNLTVEGNLEGARETICWYGTSVSQTDTFIPLFAGMTCTATDCFNPIESGSASGSIIRYTRMQGAAQNLGCVNQLELRHGTKNLDNLTFKLSPFTGVDVESHEFERGEVTFEIGPTTSLNIYYNYISGTTNCAKTQVSACVEVQYDD